MNRYLTSKLLYPRKHWKRVDFSKSWNMSNKMYIHMIKKRRKRKIIRFNPSYSHNVKSSVGKQLPELVRQHFPKSHKLNKILNKNPLKVSYSCMRNMNSILTSHNKNILAENQVQYEWNCRNKDECPLENKCLTKPTSYLWGRCHQLKHLQRVLYWVIWYLI